MGLDFNPLSHIYSFWERQVGENVISKLVIWGICIAMMVWTYVNYWGQDETVDRIIIGGSAFSIIGLIP